jgi:hypothetical protein
MNSVLIFTIASLLFGNWQEQVPFKPNEEFEVTLDYKFKERPTSSVSNPSFNFENGSVVKNKISSGSLPYLILNVRVLKAGPGEVKVRAINNKDKVLVTKKIVPDLKFAIDMGFTDDVKDRITPNEVNVYFLSDEKKELTRIQMIILSDGTFVVNGEKRGKF